MAVQAKSAEHRNREAPEGNRAGAAEGGCKRSLRMVNCIDKSGQVAYIVPVIIPFIDIIHGGKSRGSRCHPQAGRRRTGRVNR